MHIDKWNSTNLTPHLHFDYISKIRSKIRRVGLEMTSLFCGQTGTFITF